MLPYQHKAPAAKENISEKMSLPAKGAHFLFSGLTCILIALVSLLFVFTLISLLTTGAIPGIKIPEIIPTWGAVIIIFIIYAAVVPPLKVLRFRFSPHKPYSLYGSESSPKHGDTTLWLTFFILITWFISEHRSEIYAALKNFPEWWRNFVDTIGPWFYR